MDLFLFFTERKTCTPEEQRLRNYWIELEANLSEFIVCFKLERISLASRKDPGKRGHIVADTNVSPFARARNICCGHKFRVSDFVQKHFVSATNVSQFAQPKKHHGQQCVRNNVSSFTRALTLTPEFSIWPVTKDTGFPVNQSKLEVNAPVDDSGKKRGKT